MTQGQAVVDERVEVPAHGVHVLAERPGNVLGTDRVGLGLEELQDPGTGRRQPRQGVVVPDGTRAVIFHRRHCSIC